MARRKQISGTQKFITIALSLIAIEIAYLMFFSRGNAPVTVREAIVKTAEKHGELSDQRREQLKIQLALADFKAKNNRYPGNINELIPDYFDTIPVDPTNGKAYKYQVVNGRYLLGDEDFKKAAPAKLADGGGKIDPNVLASLEAANQSDLEVVAFVYNPAGKRDPFEPFDFSAATPGIDPANPLTAYDYGQLRLTSVLAGFDDPIAIVENNMGRGYTVRKGTKIGHSGGEVIEIRKDKILILENVTDFTGEKKTQTVELQLKAAKEKDRRQ